MDSELRQQMLAYYDERAPEYEEAYTLGTGTASIADPEILKTEAEIEHFGTAFYAVTGRFGGTQGR